MKITTSLLAFGAVVLSLGAMALFDPTGNADAAQCISDAELEAAVGSQIKAGAFAVNTATLGDRPLCSGLAMAQAVQKLRERYFPLDTQSRQAAQQPFPKMSSTTRMAPAEKTAGTSRWKFSQDPANPEYTAQASIEVPVRYGETVTLFIDCQKDVVSAMIGYSGNSVNLPEPKRSMVNKYMRDLFVQSPTLVVMSGASTLGRISWSPDEGGYGRVGPNQMRWLLKADQIRLMGGRQTIDFPMNAAPQALAGVIRQCRMKMG